MAPFGEYILYASCADDHVRRKFSTCMVPMLKLYTGCPVMITDNIDVEKYIANGSICRFMGLILKEGTSLKDLQTIIIDGYYIISAYVDQAKSIEVSLEENVEEGEPQIV